MAASTSGTAALFSTRFVPYSQTFIYDEVQAHERYDVDVFCKERLNEDQFPYDSGSVYHPPAWAEKIYENVAYWPSLDRQIRRGSYDLIHAHFGTTAVYALPYVWRYDLPLVVTFHGHDVAKLISAERYHPRNWRYFALHNAILEASDRILCVSTELCEFVRDLGARPETLYRHPMGIRLDRFRPSDPPPNDSSEGDDSTGPVRILMVGRFTEKKGHQYALRAFAELIAEGYDAHLSLVGDGALEEDCRRYVREQELAPHVTFHGVVSHEAVADHMDHADMLVAPSVTTRNQDREGSPMVIKEASAMSLPVVSTYHGGIPEIVEDGRTGFLVPERDVSGLADRMIRLLDDPDRRREFGQAARAKMEREFDLFKQVRTLEEHYDQVREQPSVNDE